MEQTTTSGITWSTGHRWTTHDEILFLDSIPDLVQERTDRESGYAFPVLESYERYLASMRLRKDWGGINVIAIRRHCRDCIRRWSI